MQQSGGGNAVHVIVPMDKDRLCVLNRVGDPSRGLVHIRQAERVVQLAQVPEQVRAAVLIGVDLGPNLSVTGSLATILWMTALA